jgi:hypothetical protein
LVLLTATTKSKHNLIFTIPVIFNGSQQGSSVSLYTYQFQQKKGLKEQYKDVLRLRKQGFHIPSFLFQTSGW